MRVGKKNQFKFENNSFDLWRYWAAISVMLLHYTGYALQWSNTGIEELRFMRMAVSFFPGVVVLFAISGFLIAASIEHCSNCAMYFKKRFIRIYPELWLSTIVNIGLLIVLVRDIMDKSIFFWGVTQIFGIANTPTCLKNFATGSVNGALWTIFVEIQLYIIIWFTYRVLCKLKKYQWYILLGNLAALNIACDFFVSGKGGLLPKVVERSFVPYALWFFIGVHIYVYRDTYIDKLKSFVLPLGLIYIVCFYFRESIPGYYCDIATGILCPLIVIVLGYFLPVIRIKIDITYGIFLYHWLVLNIFTYFNLFIKMNWLVGLVLFSAISFVLAFLSHVTIRLVVERK